MWVTSSEKHDPVCNHRDIPFQGLRTWQPFGEKGRTMTTFTIFQLVPAPGQASLERPKSKKTSRVIVFGAKNTLMGHFCAVHLRLVGSMEGISPTPSRACARMG